MNDKRFVNISKNLISVGYKKYRRAGWCVATVLELSALQHMNTYVYLLENLDHRFLINKCKSRIERQLTLKTYIQVYQPIKAILNRWVVFRMPRCIGSFWKLSAFRYGLPLSSHGASQFSGSGYWLMPVLAAPLFGSQRVTFERHFLPCLWLNVVISRLVPFIWWNTRWPIGAITWSEGSGRNKNFYKYTKFQATLRGLSVFWQPWTLFLRQCYSFLRSGITQLY